MSVTAKSCFGHHKGVAKATEVSGIFHFLCEDVAGIDFAWNMADFRIPALVGFADLVFTKIDMFGTLVCEGSGPIYAGLVVVVNVCALRCVNHVEIEGTIFDCLQILDAFVSSDNFGLTRVLSCLFLSDGLPGDRAAGATNEIAGKGAEFEKLKGSSNGN